MGTTESLLYDDPPTEATSTPPGLPHGATIGYPSSNPSTIDRRTERAINRDTAIRQKQHPQKSLRRRTQTQSKPIKRMEGLVLGGPKTGKRTLLSRLKGVDPFTATENNNNSIDRTKNNQTKEENPSITIQYKPPSESQTWDRIKLRIRYTNNVNDDIEREKDDTEGTHIDFVVLLINPKDSRATTHSHLEGTLLPYLDRLGYQKVDGSDSDGETKESESLNGSNLKSVRKPFCIAMLFNFRDLCEEQEEENDSAISRENLQDFVHEMLLARNVPDDKVVVELLETSLLNCYGLDGLHRFIYRTYLQRSQTDIEKQLDVVRNQILLTNSTYNHQAKENNETSKVKAYENFLKEITPKVPAKVSQEGRRDIIDSAKENPGQEQPATGRLNLRQFNHGEQTSSLPMGNDALEAFLASSSDEENSNKNAVTKERSSRAAMSDSSSSSSSDSDDDSDDDFFYDEGGNIHDHYQPIKVSQKKSRKVISKGNAHDTSDSDGDKEEQKHPEQIQNEKVKQQTRQEVAIAREVIDNKDEIEEGARIVETKKTTSIEEGDDDTDIGSTQTIGTEEHNELDLKLEKEEVTKHEQSHEENVNRDDSNDDSMKNNAISKTNYVAESEHLRNSKTEVGRGKVKSNVERESGDNHGTTVVDGDVQYFADDENCDKIIANSDIDVTDTKEKDNHDDMNVDDVISPTPVHDMTVPTLENFLESDDEDDDVHVVGSTNDKQNSAAIVADANNDDDDKVGPGILVGKTAGDSDDDDNNDGDVISPTPIVGKTVPTLENFLESDDDDNDGSTNDEQNTATIVADANNNDGDKVGPSILVEKTVGDSDDDDNDNGDIISPTPIVGKAVPTLENFLESDEEDNDEYMISSTSITENNLQITASANDSAKENDVIVDPRLVAGKVTGSNDDHDDDDDDDVHIIASNPVLEKSSGDHKQNKSVGRENDDHMSSSAPSIENEFQNGDDIATSNSVVGKVGEDDDDGNSFMISSTPRSKTSLDDDRTNDNPIIISTEDNAEDYGDDDMVTSTPITGRVVNEDDDDDDDDDGFMIGVNNDGDEDDDYMIKNRPLNEDTDMMQDNNNRSFGSSTKTQISNRHSIEQSSSPITDSPLKNDKNRASQESSLPPSGTETVSDSTPDSKPVASTGISQAALAAIALAQQEAEAMMKQQQLQRQEQYSQVGTGLPKEKKSKKKKKDGKTKDEKKKKKKKKTKGSDD